MSSEDGRVSRAPVIMAHFNARGRLIVAVYGIPPHARCRLELAFPTLSMSPGSSFILSTNCRRRCVLRTHDRRSQSPPRRLCLSHARSFSAAHPALISCAACRYKSTVETLTIQGSSPALAADARRTPSIQSDLMQEARLVTRSHKHT